MAENKKENIIVENPARIKEIPSDVIMIKKDSIWKYSTFILAAIIIVGVFVIFMKDSSVPTGQVINNPEAADSPSAKTRVEVNIKNYPLKGKADAPVTLVEYSDYQCPFCGRYFSQTLPQIQKEYVDTGKVKIVFKDFPLSFHENAEKAAEAAHCMGEQKGGIGYWSMHDKLFENQGTLSAENYKKWARELGADGAKFDTCLDSGKMAPIVQKALSEGQQDGVQGTPAFFINGQLLSGARPFEDFKNAIDAEL